MIEERICEGSLMSQVTLRQRRRWMLRRAMTRRLCRPVTMRCSWQWRPSELATS